MRRFGFVVTAAVLLCGTSASAQVITDITGTAHSTVAFPVIEGSGTFTTTYPGGTMPAPQSKSDGVSTTGFDSYVNIGASSVVFESSNVVTGPFVITQSSSTVRVGIDNPTNDITFDGRVKEMNFESTITPAGLGFYVADVGGDCLPYDCSSADGSIHTLANIIPGQGAANTVVAFAGFEFSIRPEEGEAYYSLTGFLSYYYNADGNLAFEDGLGFRCPPFSEACFSNGARARLADFHNGPNNDWVLGYGWGATHIGFGIGTADQTLIYETKVTSISAVDCQNSGSTCLLAYAGFGDPIGRGTSDTALEAFSFGFSALDNPLAAVQGLNFQATTVPLDEFADVSFVTNGVPEPATWLSMILGFGLMGTALRRSRVLAHV
jgi:hypothetical protein